MTLYIYVLYINIFIILVYHCYYIIDICTQELEFLA